MSCKNCKQKPAIIIRPANREKLCKECFLITIETQVHLTITKSNMFKDLNTLIIGVSGGKDSTVLAYILNFLNRKYCYNLKLKLLCIDEGISGYRDKSIEVVKKNEKDLKIPLTILSYNELYGYSMDSVVNKIGNKSNCTYCGVFRRGALEKGANLLQGQLIATGHNADDISETILLNYFRGDFNRLTAENNPNNLKTPNCIRRCKPLSEVYEKEIVMYAFYRELPYFSTECKYSPGAFRGYARNYVKELEKIDPAVILRIIKWGNKIKKDTGQREAPRECEVCGRICSGSSGICKSCLLLRSLDE